MPNIRIGKQTKITFFAMPGVQPTVITGTLVRQWVHYRMCKGGRKPFRIVAIQLADGFTTMLNQSHQVFTITQ
jgi:hypothetical protein